MEEIFSSFLHAAGSGGAAMAAEIYVNTASFCNNNNRFEKRRVNLNFILARALLLAYVSAYIIRGAMRGRGCAEN